MNLCVLAGRIVQNASVKGTDRKILRFTVETRDGHDEGETKERINQIGSVNRLRIMPSAFCANRSG